MWMDDHCGAAVLVGCALQRHTSAGRTRADSGAAKPAAEPAAHKPGNCPTTGVASARFYAKAPATYQVKFTTTKGDFVITVTRAWAPLGADRFYNLVRHHFYDNTHFFRVLKGFVVQWGISAYPPVTAAW